MKSPAFRTLRVSLCSLALVLGCVRRDAVSPATQPAPTQEASPKTGVIEDEPKGGDELPHDPAPAPGPPSRTAEGAPATRYRTMNGDVCLRELGARGVVFADASPARGVLIPIRLQGPLAGVVYRSFVVGRAPSQSPYEIMDCRLALSLFDWSSLLRPLGVREVLHYSAYRPPPKRFPDGKIASRHPGGLAMDVAVLVRDDGSKLDVDRDFHGKIGKPVCDKGAHPEPETEEAKTLWRLACASSERGIFHIVLTPNFNAPHKNHFHVEVTAKGDFFLIK